MTTKLKSHEPPRSLTYRASVFAFGVTAYALGVGVLAALILIMLDLLPFTGGPLGKLPLESALAVDLSLLVVFALQHSLMARPSFKARWTLLVSVAAERSVYMFATMPAVVWFVEAPALRWLLIGVALSGWTYLLLASFAINHFELFGLQQVYRVLCNLPPTHSPFKVRWMYRFDRHPIMTGILLGVWVTPTMTLDHLLFAIGMTVYVWVGVYFEERSLRAQLGRPYEEYCQRVRSIVPIFEVGRFWG